MAFILRSSKYVSNFLGLARRASLTCKRKEILMDHVNIFRFNELCPRTAATAAPKPISIFPFSIEKSLSNLNNNLKASMVDLFNVECALNALKENGVISPSQLILLLKCCGSAAFKDSEDNRIKMAKTVWNTAKELGTEFDIAHYNTLLSVFVENSYKFSPQQILSDIKQAGLEPDRVTYRHLLKAFCQQGDIEGAGNLLQQIKEKNFPINEYDFCSLIQGHCEAGELDEAAKVFAVMKDRGIEVSLQPYVYLLCGYAKQGNIQKIEELLDELQTLSLNITDTCLLNVVYTLIVNNHVEHMDSILAKMKKNVDFEKTLVRVVHRILHRNKVEEALKLFSFLNKMGNVQEYVQDQAHTIVDHFLTNRTPKEVLDICRRLQEEGWSQLAFSHALKVGVLRQDLEFCSTLMKGLKENGFPIRSHYFWPLLVRYSKQGNSGIMAVLETMKKLGVPVCFSTLHMFIADLYTFGGDWHSDLGAISKCGANHDQVCRILLHNFLSKGDMKRAEDLVSSHRIFRPLRQTLGLLTKSLIKNPSSKEKFINILYGLAHDFTTYSGSFAAFEEEDEEDGQWTGLNTFFHSAFTKLLAECPEELLLSLLKIAPKKKVMIPPQTADETRARFPNPEMDALLKEFTESNAFELNEDLLKKKSENMTVLPKLLDPNGVQQLANRNDPKAEEVWEEIGPKATPEDHLAILLMHTRNKEFDKAFNVIDRMKASAEIFDNSEDLKKKFRISLHRLRDSGNVEKTIYAHGVGIYLGLIDENHVMPVLRTILNCCDIDTALKDYPQFFEKIKSVGLFLEVLDCVLPSGNAEAVEKLTHYFSRATNRNAALTALFTAYLSKGLKAEAKALLESEPFRFQHRVFMWWFQNTFLKEERSFEDIMNIVKELSPQDRAQVYEFLLGKYEKERDVDNIRTLWMHCQEDNVTDPFFLEHLRQCVRIIEKAPNSPGGGPLEMSSNTQWSEEKAIEDLLKVNKYTEETLEKLMRGKLSSRLARKMLPVLAGQGKCSELILVLNKYKFGRYASEVATHMLKKKKVDEFLEFVSAYVSMKKYAGVYNSFASQQDRILDLMKTDESFFDKFKELSLRCYVEGKYEALLVLFLKLSIQIPEKLPKAEELLDAYDSRLVSHFRNYALSNILLSSSEEVDFYKNALRSDKVKGVFSEVLDHFYEGIINFYNEKGDVKSALSYLEKARQDGVEEKLNKRVIASLKKNLEERGTAFPYPQLLQETA